MAEEVVPGMTCEGVSSPPRVRAVPVKLVGGGREEAVESSGRGRFLSKMSTGV